MAYTAAAMYGVVLVGAVIEQFLPGDPPFSLLPVIVVGVLFGVTFIAGPRLKPWMLIPLGPLGVALNGYALATAPYPGDGAALYLLPVVWTSLFCGRRGAIGIVAWVGVVHAIVLLELPAAVSYPGRWVDVMMSVVAVAVVVDALEHRNRRLLDQLLADARTDALTHLLNRRGFDERAVVELAHARRYGVELALIEFDIDFFKRINDEWGHEMGDRVLVSVGEILLSCAREIDVVARVGGEEFVVLLPGGDQAGARALAERVRATVASELPLDLPPVRISAGIACADQHTGVQTLLRQADSALYEAKRSGRDRTAVFARNEATV